MASTTAATSALDSPVTSRKRPAEEESSEGVSDQDKPTNPDQPTDTANGTNDEEDDSDERAPAKRARTEEDNTGEETSNTEGDGVTTKEEEEKEKEKEEKEKEGGQKQTKAEGEEEKKEGTSSPLSSKIAFLPTVGFSSFSTYAPLSFSSVSSSSSPSSGKGKDDLPPIKFDLGAISSSSSSSSSTFSIDFSSPTPFGSLFGSSSSSSSSSPSGAPALSSTGFTLFSSIAPATSSEFSFNLAPSTSSLLFSPAASESSAPVAEKVEVVTGEEEEERVYSVRAKLLKLEQDTKTWKEKGSGQLHLNLAKDRSYARLVMRAEGALRLILNVALYPHTITKRVQEKGVQVSAVEEGKPELYLLRVSRRDEAEELFAAIELHKNTVAKESTA